MTLVRDRELRKDVIFHKSPGFTLPFINKLHTKSSEKYTRSYSVNLHLTRLTGYLRYFFIHNFDRRKPIIVTRGRSNILRRKRDFSKEALYLNRESPGSPERYRSDKVYPSVSDHIYSMDYQKVSANPPSYRPKPLIFK